MTGVHENLGQLIHEPVFLPYILYPEFTRVLDIKVLLISPTDDKNNKNLV